LRGVLAVCKDHRRNDFDPPFHATASPMLITRAPLRVSIGGGGTDLPSYYERRGGFVISAAIDKYVFIALNSTFTTDFLIKYSKLERVDDRRLIEHPIVREAFELHNVEPGIEMVSVADIPSGTGLGSSGTFTVALLKAIHALQRKHATDGAIAEEAAHIEIDRLGESVGKQDQYIAAFGGITCFDFHADGTVNASPLAIDEQALALLEERLVLFFTGYTRSAGSVLDEQKTRSETDDAEMLEGLDRTKELGLEIRRELESGNPAGFGELMNEHWQRKRQRSKSMSNPQIDHWYDVGLANGAVGGKLVGAGAGGFLMFYADDPEKLRTAMTAEGLAEMRFRFDLDGATVIVRN
jgi:D-glycero-alpha-D-manno-heptose-7-phosphate kinase